MNVISKETYDLFKETLNELEIDILNGKILNRSECEDKDGYLQFSLKKKTVRSHHAIGFLIFGERMVGKQINHIDGDKQNNKPNNLELVSPSENVRHAFNTGLKKALWGTSSKSAKLNETDILNIKSMREKGKTLKEIGDIYGVSFQQVSRICRGERWGHLPKIMDIEITDMSFEKYETLSQRTANIDLEDFDEVANYALGLVSEASEVTDQIKKELFHGHEPNQEKIRDELSDVLWYMSNLARKYNLSLKEIATHNIQKLKQRYPNGFNKADSIRRIDVGEQID